jgi:hypothetical protein
LKKKGSLDFLEMGGRILNSYKRFTPELEKRLPRILRLSAYSPEMKGKSFYGIIMSYSNKCRRGWEA